MATCGSLHHFFEKPLPENPTLLESLATWNQIKPRKPIEPSSFTEIFGELHFEEKPKSPQPSSSPLKTLVEGDQHSNVEKANKSHSPSLDAFLGLSKIQHNSSRAKNSGSSSLQLCTEGLGFESSDDVEDFESMKVGEYFSDCEIEKLGVEKHCADALRGGSERCWDDVGTGGGFKRSKPAGEFPPPPITSMGRQGKPSFFLKSYRQDGRFVLREFKVPSQEFLHACREDGRLKLNFVIPDKTGSEYGGEENGSREEQETEEIHIGESLEAVAGNGIS